jgi:hypothetical protein
MKSMILPRKRAVTNGAALPIEKTVMNVPFTSTLYPCGNAFPLNSCIAIVKVDKERDEKERKAKLMAERQAAGLIKPKVHVEKECTVFSSKVLSHCPYFQIVSECLCSLVTQEQKIAQAYAYVPGQAEAPKKAVDPNDPFGEIELIEWGTKKRRY